MSKANKIASATAGLSDTAKNVIVIGGVALVGFGIYKVFSIVDGVTSAVTDPLNDIKDVVDKKKELANKLANELAKWENSKDFKMAFTPDPWKGKIGNYSLVSNEVAMSFAKRLYDAIDKLDDDESAVYDVYRRTPSKASMMKVATAFSVKYKKDLYTELKDNLNTVELLKIAKIISDKKDYTKKSK